MAGDFLGEMFEPESVVTEPEPTPTQEAAPPEQQAPEPAPPPEPANSQSEPAAREDQRIPLPVFLDMRDAKNAAQREAQELKRQLQARETPAPNPYDDPEGALAATQSQFQAALHQQKVAMSYEMAKSSHGEDTVEKASQWALEKAQTDPVFRATLDNAMASQVLPVDWIVREHKRNALLSDIGDNVDDWFTREAVKRGYALQSAAHVAAPVLPTVAAPQAAKPAAPPRSIAADAPASGRVVDDSADFAAIFSRK